MQIEIQIPKAVLFDVKYTVEQATNFAKKEVALGFYMQKGVSVALCSQIAGMSEKEFLVEVKDRKYVGLSNICYTPINKFPQNSLW